MDPSILKDWCCISNTVATWCEEPALEKTLMLARMRAGREGGDRGWDGWSIADSMDMSLSKLWEVVMDREVWRAAVHGVTKNWIQLRDWRTTKFWYFIQCSFHSTTCPSLSLRLPPSLSYMHTHTHTHTHTHAHEVHSNNKTLNLKGQLSRISFFYLTPTFNSFTPTPQESYKVALGFMVINLKHWNL